MRTCTALAVALATSQVSPAVQAQAPTGVATYQIVALTNGLPTLCPGEQLVLNVGVHQTIVRTSTSGTVSSSQSVPHAYVDGYVHDPAIGTLSGASPVRLGGLPAPGGGFYGQVTFTARKPGQTTLNFSGTVFNQTIPHGQLGWAITDGQSADREGHERYGPGIGDKRPQRGLGPESRPGRER